MRALGGLFIGIGCVLALIAAVWGRSGYYLSQAPILFMLAIGGLICLGIGAGILRYQKARFVSSADARAAITERAFKAPTAIVTPEAASLVATPAVAPLVASTAALPAVVAAPATLETPDSPDSPNTFDSLEEETRDRPPRTTDWVLVLPDATVLPIADALVIGRQPVSSDGGP
ncbi:MAG: hypothetical protein JWP75_3442, partial [Frondihabitans sp.]|nr:hypothetical protein [Frondihabitans sp.]